MPILKDITVRHPHQSKRVAANSTQSRNGTVSPPVLTAGELIALLQATDPAAPVVIRGQYGGFECVHGVAQQPLRLNVNSHDGFGPHDLPEDGESADIVAVAIGCGYAPIVD